jgi:hypothetical protein
VRAAGAPPSGQWIAGKGPAGAAGVVWLVRPMPDGQWPPDWNRPRDDSYLWWVRSHCGHQDGARQWAFYEEGYARAYEAVFREDPCRYTQCPRRRMADNEREAQR